MTDPIALAKSDAEEYGDEFDNCCASCTQYCGSRLTRPVTWWLLYGTKLIAKLNPGQRAQCNSCFGEVLMRMYYVILLLVLLPFALIFGGIGSLLRLCAATARKELIFYAGHENTPFTTPDTEPLRITTFNTALMPNFITSYNGLRPPLKRVREIAVAIRHTGDHFICLQEVFHPHAGRELRALLKDVYPYIIYNVGFQSMGLDSGLALFSKYPLSNPRYILHPIRDGDDKWARKGVLMATAHLGGGRRIVMLVTHLNGGGPNSEAARRRQIFHVTKSLREYITEQNAVSPRAGASGPGPAPQPIMAAFQCGDFNIGPMTKEGLPDKEWASHVDFFTRYNHHYITIPERLQGTTFDFDIMSVGWAMQQLDQWKLTNERVDQILCHVGGALTPAAQATGGVNGQPANNGNVSVAVGGQGTGLHLQVPYGELRVDRMHGSSDHAAIRGVFTWGRPALPLEGDGQPSIPLPLMSGGGQGVIGVDMYGNPVMAGQQQQDTGVLSLPGVHIGYGAGGGFAAPAGVTIHQ